MKSQNLEYLKNVQARQEVYEAKMLRVLKPLAYFLTALFIGGVLFASYLFMS